MEDIKFYGTHLPYFEFSNFYRAEIVIDDKSYPTTEHYYQSKKFEGTDYEEKVRLCKTPGDAAKMGRDKSLPLRKDWEQVKDDVMLKALRAKFTQHLKLKEKLLSTGDRKISEWTKNDSYWGEYHSGGQNKLGLSLMKVRSELK